MEETQSDMVNSSATFFFYTIVFKNVHVNRLSVFENFA